MSYLLDTCVVSELIQKNPDKNVIRWFELVEESNLYLSVLTIGEIYKGIEKLPPGKKKNEITLWMENDLKNRFDERILKIDSRIAKKWGELIAAAEKRGRPIPSIDSLLCATALVYDLAIVTRNSKDMESSGVIIVNPWGER